MYSIDWIRFIRERIPAVLRKAVHLAWLRALIAPVVYLHTAFLAFVLRINEQIRTTGQVVKLRYGLNTKFDPSEQRIEIFDATAFETLFIFLESENRPVYLPRFIGGSAYEFEVHIPAELMNQEVYIRAFLDAYKLAGKRYIIVWT